MKYVSIFSVTLKSAITPSFIGLMATTFPGVRPSISLASFPTATTSELFLLIATMEGSFTTMPLPLEKTSVLAVPRSIAKSEENKLKTERKLYPFFLIMTLGSGCSLVAPRPARPPRGGLARSGWRAPRLRNHNRHALDHRASPAVLPGDDNRVAAAGQRLGEMPETPVVLNIGHRLPVDNQGCAGLGAADHLDNIAMQLRAIHLEQHLLALTLGHQGELVGFAGLARMFVRVNRRHVPEIVAGIEPRHFGAGARRPLVG